MPAPPAWCWKTAWTSPASPSRRNAAPRRAAQRAAWGVAEHQLVVGCAARFDPQKDHAGLARAFALGAPANAVLALAGAGCTHENAALLAMLAAAGVAGRTLLLGPVQDMAGFHAGADLLAIGSAFGEALPMVGLEAVAAGLPIAATSLGACAELMLNLAHLAAPGDPAALGRAMAAAQRCPAGRTLWPRPGWPGCARAATLPPLPMPTTRSTPRPLPGAERYRASASATWRTWRARASVVPGWKASRTSGCSGGS